LFLLPLSLDTFAVAAALGALGLPKRERLRVSLLMSSFEMAMPLVGLLLGRGLGAAVGSVADFIAVAVLGATGLYMLLAGEEREERRIAQLSSGRGLALVALAVSVSLDELAIGFSIGLLHLPVAVAVLLIGVQAFLAAQIGLRVGSRISAAGREAAERLAAAALLGLALFLLVDKLTR
jgi:manganese efflux pump family protein